MKILIITLFVIAYDYSYLLADSQWISCCPCPSELIFSKNQLSEFTKKADYGDPDSAMLLSKYYNICKRDNKNGEKWLRKAAILKHPKAQYRIGMLIKDFDKDFSEFGETQKEALFNLFYESCSNNILACAELPPLFENDFPDQKKLKTARKYLINCSEKGYRYCWEKLSEYYYYGIGGDINYPESYFWISLETMCMNQKSVNLKEIWSLRENVAQKIKNYDDFVKTWNRLDQYLIDIKKGKIRIDPPRLADDVTQKNLENIEVKHKQKIRQLFEK